VQAGDAGQVIYHASVFGVKDSYDTIFDAGCFKRTIDHHAQLPSGVTVSDFLANAPGGYFPMVWFHAPWEPLGLSKVSEDSTGLLVYGELDIDIERGRDIYSGMKRGYINCASHGFDVITETIEDGDSHFKEVALYETSPLTMNFAANPSALVEEVRARTGLVYPAPHLDALADFLRNLPEAEAMEAVLREVREGKAFPVAERLRVQKCFDSLSAFLAAAHLLDPEAHETPSDRAESLTAPDPQPAWLRVLATAPFTAGLGMSTPGGGSLPRNAPDMLHALRVALAQGR